ncbi:aldo/keto reductase [Curtobacterium sp. ISL-83]|uniref:aldo/keto reductase n=1 Tax=Curtobacterium sp. ISL-83 TaxID=2819145 RepID=UPI001BE979B9|nr:aldo/keto reductase [Curtobacterium sp. ISL-83]MBT2501702.1 aldo/keto reductase [Curtobacterium sp. ISL-83]
MKYTRLGNSGLQVSRIALGCMSFGTPGKTFDWTLEENDAQPFFRQAVELGITFWDTANYYSLGNSEEIVGRAMREYASRDQIVLATKVFYPMGDNPGDRGLSRKAIMQQIDASLTRLDTDYVDLYQIHRFDPNVPVEETMEALHDVVKAGKARYIGASSMWAWQFATLQHVAESNGWTKFVSMQDQYSLLQREEEREMFPLLKSTDVGSIPWSPLALGLVARPWGSTGSARGTTADDLDEYGHALYNDTDKDVIDAVEKIAKARGVSMAQIGLAWVMHNPVVTAPIIGATKEHHLTDAAAAVDIELTDDELKALEEHYTFREPSHFV